MFAVVVTVSLMYYDKYLTNVLIVSRFGKKCLLNALNVNVKYVVAAADREVVFGSDKPLAFYNKARSGWFSSVIRNDSTACHVHVINVAVKICFKLRMNPIIIVNQALWSVREITPTVAPPETYINLI